MLFRIDRLCQVTEVYIMSAKETAVVEVRLYGANSNINLFSLY